MIRRAAVVAVVLLAACTAKKDGPDCTGPDAAASGLASSAPTAVADGTDAVTLTATVLDRCGAPLADAAVAFAVDGGENDLSAAGGATGPDGTFAVVLKSTRAETKTATATVEGLALPEATLTFTPAPPSASRSGITAPAEPVAADGATLATVTVTVLDPVGRPMEGEPVTLASTGATLPSPIPEATTGADGVATFALTAIVATTGTLTATIRSGDDSIVIAATPTLAFFACQEGQSFCGGTCFALNTDDRCGACDVACARLDRCGGATCVPRACDECHGAPPTNGAHARHDGAATPPTVYGGLGTAADRAPGGGGYAFDCGHCHPTDPAKHDDGLLQVELYSDVAPPGSMKALHPPTATWTPGTTTYAGEAKAFTDGTCSNVYCHSGNRWAAPSVPAPEVDFPFVGYPIVYPDFTITTTRSFRSPKWVGETLSCDGCHDFPPRTSSPTNVAGAGDSHAWQDQYGYDNLHAWSMGLAPIACATCHFDTVIAQGVRYFAPADHAVYEPVPISGPASHVNGRADVRFTTESVVLGVPGSTRPAVTFSAATGATWNATTRTCGSVSCHELQTSVRWGTPYRWENAVECMDCHQY